MKSILNKNRKMSLKGLIYYTNQVYAKNTFAAAPKHLLNKIILNKN